MAIDGMITITYGDRVFGGSNDTYRLDGPYSLTKDFELFRLVFNVVVVGTSYANLQSKADDLEIDMSKRDQDLVIDIDESLWTYTEGADLLNVTGSATKSGDTETDRGFSRAYTCVVEGSLPADDGGDTGLQSISFSVIIEPGRQHTLTMRGVYTATSSEAQASENYLNNADAEATAFLAAFAGKTFELVEENYDFDRNNHACEFLRQYSEILLAQSQSVLDDPQIKDHRVTFTETRQHPGDSRQNIHRLRRVVAEYNCAVDIDETTDLQAVFENKIDPHLRALFELNFKPAVFVIDDKRLSYDETAKRISVAIQFLYQPNGGSRVLEISESVAYSELRALDVTPLHDQDELAAEVNVGWATVQRIASRTVVVFGSEEPVRRLGRTFVGVVAGGGTGPTGLPSLRIADGGAVSGRVKSSGWNMVSNTSQSAFEWLGDPDFTQEKITTLTETVIEQLTRRPDSGSTGFRAFSGV